MRGYGSGVLLIVAGVALAVVLLLAPPVSASSQDPEATARRDFDGLVRAVGEHYHVHAKTVPMMGLVSLCAKVMTQGGVDGMRVAQFEDAAEIARRDRADVEAQGFAGLVRTRLGDGWTQVIREHQESGAESLVYVQDLVRDGGSRRSSQAASFGGSARRMRLIALDLDGSELNMVSLSLGPEELASWVNEREQRRGWKRAARARGSDGSGDTPPDAAGDRVD
ncbi:MAG TPA: hypothetical protein VNW54_11205 [Granulicella sp.]|nr:hypothetical protein [Granulicella sp.]